MVARRATTAIGTCQGVWVFAMSYLYWYALGILVPYEGKTRLTSLVLL
jgi:hypothetical protein